MAGVWGVATLFSPLIGGVFAQMHFWRGAFWIFAAQGLAFIAATALLVPRGTAPPPAEGRPPFLQIVVLAAAVTAIGAAGLLPTPIAKAAAGAAGLALLVIFLRLDMRAPITLLPRTATRATSGVAAGLFMVFALNVGTTAFGVYGTSLMQRLYGATPIMAGYVLGGGAMGWNAERARGGRQDERPPVHPPWRSADRRRAGRDDAGRPIRLAGRRRRPGAGRRAGFGMLWAFAAARHRGQRSAGGAAAGVGLGAHRLDDRRCGRRRPPPARSPPRSGSGAA